MTTITPLERVRRAIEFRQPDRLPIVFWNRDQTEGDVMLYHLAQGAPGDGSVNAWDWSVNEWGYRLEKSGDGTMGHPVEPYYRELPRGDEIRVPALRALLFLRRLKNSSSTLTTMALTLTPSASAQSLSLSRASAPTWRSCGLESSMPALRVCMMSTFSRSTWLKAKRTILARSPFTRDSSVTASRRSMGRRSVIPGRSSVHRCPSRFTFRAAFFAAFLTATGCPSETVP